MDELTCTHGHSFVVLDGEVVWTCQTCVPCDLWVRGESPAPADRTVSLAA